MKKVNLPKSTKEVKVWLKRLGIRRIEVAQMAIYRDRLAAKAIKEIGRRDYEYAGHFLRLADKANDNIEINQDFLDGLYKETK